MDGSTLEKRSSGLRQKLACVLATFLVFCPIDSVLLFDNRFINPLIAVKKKKIFFLPIDLKHRIEKD